MIFGVLKIGTPLVVKNRDLYYVGTVLTIEKNKTSIKEARKKTGSVSIKLKSEKN